MSTAQVGEDAGTVPPKKKSAKDRTGRSADLAAFAKWSVKKRTNVEQGKAIDEQLAVLEPRVLSHFEHMGIDRVRVRKMTVYLRRQLWVGRQDGVSNEDAVEALRAAGMPEFTEPRLKTQGLSAWVREMDKSNEGGWAAAMPEALKPVLKVSEVLSVQTRVSD